MMAHVLYPANAAAPVVVVAAAASAAAMSDALELLLQESARRAVEVQLQAGEHLLLLSRQPPLRSVSPVAAVV